MSVPFLILHGEEDTVCSIKGSKKLMEEAQVRDKTLRTFPGAWHNLFRELPDVRQEAVNSTVHWLIEHIPTVEILG